MLDVQLEDRFLLRQHAKPGEFIVTALNERDIALSRFPRGETVEIEFTEFAVQHSEGNIVRIARAGQKVPKLSVKRLISLFPPEGRQVTAGEAADWDEEFQMAIHAAIKQFYGNRYIDHRRTIGVSVNDHRRRSEVYAKTEDDLADFIAGLRGAAAMRGFGSWTPSASTIRRVVFEKTEHVTLADCMRKTGGERKRKIWPSWVYELSDEAIERHFRGEFPTPEVTYQWFFGQFHKERDVGVGIPVGKRPTPPSEKVFNIWLRKAFTPANDAKLNGQREANKRWKGIIKPQDAHYPLHIVIIDQTLGNIWSAVKKRTRLPGQDFADQEESSSPTECAETLGSKRVEVVYAIDVFTRMKMAMILTFEPPSISTFMACLKMVMTPKTRWRSQFPDLPDATDGYGKPTVVVVDNLRAHITKSVQLGLLSLGISIEYAPLMSPEWKSIVERAIGTCKRVMATLPGGFSIDDENVNSPDYQKYARLDLDQIHDFVSHQIITEHHMRVHSGTGEPPGFRWAKNLPLHGRSMVHDMRVLDLLLRRRDKGVLTRAGVHFKGYLYTNPAYVTRTLNANAAETTGKPGGKKSLEVDVLWSSTDISSLGIVDPKTDEVIHFQNGDPLFAKLQVSFEFGKSARKENAKIFDEYYPATVRAKYLREYFAKLEATMPQQKHREAKRTARLLEGGRAVVISPDVQQFDVVIPVTDLGVSRVDVPVQLALGHKRGKTETPKQKGPNKKSKKSNNAESKPQAMDDEVPRAPLLFAMSLEESEAYLDQLEHQSDHSHQAIRH
ncbi:hypothetical protein [Rhizobium laguerreae]|uniref:hypothetical protein n=1 Tax=Rhizobium laguerreae TaxID=1076926 RepID=UPI001C9113BA|nr:hypothetical protein [Rhizobium laguerreae]MBY3117316.1 transposase family protein [Rhizobium laguerreae]